MCGQVCSCCCSRAGAVVLRASDCNVARGRKVTERLRVLQLLTAALVKVWAGFGWQGSQLPGGCVTSWMAPGQQLQPREVGWFLTRQL